jgi:cobalt-zinc-cadmium efflux system membrane fusion protein
MSLQEHVPTARGRMFFWGGIALGLLVVVLLLTHGFGLFSYRAAAEPQAAFVRKGEQIVVPEGSALRARLTVMPARSEPLSPQWVLPGIVESDPARTAAVLPALSGRVAALKVALGDRVMRGQVVALIDSPDLAQAYADDEKAADAYRLTQKNLARQEEQLKLGAVSDRDLDQARSDDTQAHAEYARTQTRLRAIGASDASGRSARLLSVTAPLTGSVTALAIAAGNMINDPTQPIMTVADLGTIWVTALVPEKDLAGIAKDQEAEVTLLAYPERRLHGKILFASDVIEPDSRRDKIRIAFPNASYDLKPNMFATVTLRGPQRSRVVVPSSALLMNNDRTSVFVATAPWTFERRTVEPQLQEGATVAIASGLNAGEQVVVRGGILLND